MPAHSPTLRDCLLAYYDFRRRISSAVHNDALTCFQRVSARQPHVAQVWSGLAMLYIEDYAATFGRGGDSILESARAATDQALAIDADDFLANLALTRMQFFDGDAAFSETIDRALKLRPDSSEIVPKTTRSSEAPRSTSSLTCSVQ